MALIGGWVEDLGCLPPSIKALGSDMGSLIRYFR